MDWKVSTFLIAISHLRIPDAIGDGDGKSVKKMQEDDRLNSP
ncbi:MAG: hypothetical protein ABSB74_03965 [Tepidisphaeraceae bacterium]